MSNYDDDDIGYRKPPKYTRFPKGVSGNPKGRPQKAKKKEPPLDTEFDDSLRALLSEKKTITKDGKRMTVTVAEAVMMKQQMDALSGSVTAQREVLRSKEGLDARDADRKAAAEKEAIENAQREEKRNKRLYEYYMALHASQSKVYARAQADSCDPIPRYPHPDDFRFDHHGQTAQLMGPADEMDAQHFLRMAKQSDVHFLNYVILNRQRPRGTRFEREIAQLSLIHTDLMLPERTRIIVREKLPALQFFLKLPLKDIRKWKRGDEHWLERYPSPDLTNKQKREVYKETNAIMKPILNSSGYRSLAHFESVYGNSEMGS